MLPFMVIIPVLIAVFLFVLSTNKVARVLAIVFQCVFIAVSFYLFSITRYAEIVTHVGSYDDVLGIILRANNTVSVFILLTSFIFLAVAIYSYNEEGVRTFWFLLFILEAVIIGLFLTRDLFNIFVLVEVGTVVITALLMYYRGRRQMFGGMVFFMLNLVAMQFYLFGIGYLYMLVGAFDLEYVKYHVSNLCDSLLVLPYALIMTGLAFKCSIIPLYSFLPKVKVYPAAPSAVVAILSGVQIKVSVFIFIQLQEVFGSFAAENFFLGIGIATGLISVFMAMCQSDIKMILAFHTISQVGLIIIGLSAGSKYSILGGMYHIISHGMFKTTLFLTAGILFHSYGTRDVYKIRGVMKRLPLVGIATIAAVLGITGAPFFIGSISKYFISTDVPLYVEWSVIIISLGTVISFIKYSSMLFGTADPNMTGDAVQADKWRLAPSVGLGIACLLGGVFGGPLVRYLFATDATINPFGYFQKALIFFASVGIGLLIYNYFVKGNKTLKKVGNMDVGFRGICASIGIFFGVLLVVTGLL